MPQLLAPLVRFALLASLLLSLPLVAAGVVSEERAAPFDPSPLVPVYHIPLRVHLADSGRPVGEFPAVFAEINRIWRSQAGISFAIEVVWQEEAADEGLDMYFEPDIGGLNGFYDGELIRMSDHPRLRPALQPSASPAGRTAAHELGHALGLPHRQDSDDNLMRSQTLGWRLSAAEVKSARATARRLATARRRAPLRAASAKPGQH